MSSVVGFLVERVWIVWCKGLGICSLYCLNVGVLMERVSGFEVFGFFFCLRCLFFVERVWIVCCKGLDICSLYCLNVGFLI